MLKRVALLCVMTMTSSACLAGNFYVGPMALIETVTASDSNFRGISPRLSLGYDQYLGSEFRLAGELFGTPATLKIDENTPAGVNSAKIKKSFGASILPAYMFSETFKGYARLGAIRTLFEGPNAYGNGLQFGLGVAVKTSECWEVRAEYDYITYRSVSGLGSPTADFLGIGMTYDLTNMSF